MRWVVSWLHIWAWTSHVESDIVVMVGVVGIGRGTVWCNLAWKCQHSSMTRCIINILSWWGRLLLYIFAWLRWWCGQNRLGMYTSPQSHQLLKWMIHIMYNVDIACIYVYGTCSFPYIARCLRSLMFTIIQNCGRLYIPCRTSIITKALCKSGMRLYCWMITSGMINSAMRVYSYSDIDIPR